MTLEAALERLAPLVAEVRARLGVPPEARLEDLVRVHGLAAPDSSAPDPKAVTPAALARLYELRARHLDWTYETGYLGFFARNPGTRYCFTRRIEEKLSLIEPRPDGACLEVGCGAGILAVILAPRFREVIATDVSPTALRFTGLLAQRAGASNLRVAEADAARLPFPDGAFATVICGEVIGQVTDARAVARELARVTSPGGTLLLSTPCALSPTQAALRIASVLRPGLTLHREWTVDRRVAEKLREAGEEAGAGTLLRVKRRMRYRKIVALMASCGMRLRAARGATLDLPPPALVYPMIPGKGLAFLRALERGLNALRILPRALALTTVFRFEKRPEAP